MSDKSNFLAASDLNGTLTRGSPVLAVARWLSENQPGTTPALLEVRLMLSYLSVLVGWKKIDAWGEQAMNKVLSLVQGPTPVLLEEVMDYVVEEELWPKRRKEPIAMLREFHARGGDLYLLSAAYQPAVKKFARKIAPERTYGIGTAVEFDSEGLRLARDLNSRERKMSNLRAAIGPRQLNIAMGDTFADIPLLVEAKRAIAVHPDRKLRKAALQHGWQILG